MTRALLIGLALLLVGCGTKVPVDLTAAASRDAAFKPLRRFAVVHGSTGENYSRLLARETANALQNKARRDGCTPLIKQQPLTTSADSNERMHELAAMAKASLSWAGYRHDGRDPDFTVSIEFATGPFDYRTPDRPIANQSHGTRAGWLERSYGHGVMLRVCDADRRDQPIWVGYAVSVNDEPEFTEVAPALIEELARTYPAATAPVRRMVTLR